MRHRSLVIRATTTLLACGCVAGCTSIEQEYCERQIEDCNGTYLGIRNVDECTEQVEKHLDSLVSSKREDCENGIESCLDKANCQNFQQCMTAVVLLDCL